MSIKISELPIATNVNTTDIVPIVQEGTTKQADISKFSNASSVPMGATFQYDGDTIPVGYEEVNGLETYSTTEQVVGTWIDGRPLYEKTINYTSPLVAGINRIEHNITNLERGFLVSCFVPYHEVGEQYQGSYQVPCFNGDTEYLTVTNVNTTHINLTVGSTWGSSFTKGCIVTIRYFKTTDSAS